MLETRDTIVAIATPPGRGGIGIVRLSGPDALAIGRGLLRLRGALVPGRARFCEVVDQALSGAAGAAMGAVGEDADGSAGEPVGGGKLDEAIATYFEKPHSYTGEDVLEIAAHGSPVLLDFLLRQMIARGARPANPGEFTERAFLAGRLDLTQAEAVRDLIDAQTLYQARVAASQLDGALSRRVAPIKRALIGLIAQLEAGIDFAEDDTPTLSAAALLGLAEPISEQLAALARSFEHGRLVHAGLTLAIVGEPNVGKSSLFNQLVERNRAIVTNTPGTTRDLVSERVSLGGIPIELVDTAGLRPAVDEAERLGIEKSREALAEADLVLLVVDASASSPAAREMFELVKGRRAIVVLNKCDLVRRDAVEGYLQQSRAQIGVVLPESAVAVTSAQTGEGLGALRELIQKQLQTPEWAEQGGMLTNLRQHQAVEAAQAGLRAAIEAAPARIPHEMLLLDFYTALRHLDALTGETTPDDILNLIFSSFCIGK